MTSKHAKALVQSITELFGDSSYADATIVCGERKWKVHKAVVCTRCEYLKKAFDGHFKEGEDSTIALQEDHPNAVAAMLRYLYSSDYDDRAHHESEDDDWKALPMNVHVQDIGDKYCLPGLTALALSKFKKLIDAEDFNAPGFLQAIPAVYSNDEDHKAPYRESLMECVIENGKVLLARKDFQEVAKGVPAFATALVSEAFRLDMKEELELGKSYPTYRCPDCRLKFTVEVTASMRQKTEAKLCCPRCANRYYRLSVWESSHRADRE